MALSSPQITVWRMSLSGIVVGGGAEARGERREFESPLSAICSVWMLRCLAGGITFVSASTRPSTR
jgi:hypothetical protein